MFFSCFSVATPYLGRYLPAPIRLVFRECAMLRLLGSAAFACSATLLLSALFAQSASAQDPFKDPAPEAIKAGWGNASIPINSREKFFFGPQGCPVVLVEVWF